MTPEQIKFAIILILGFSFILNLVTTALSSKTADTKLPPELEDVYSPEKHEESVRYILTNSNFSIITGSLSFIATIIFIFFDGFALLNSYLVNSNLYDGITELWFFGILFFTTDILNIPFQLYAQFSIEERFGFNKMSYSLFFSDKIKSWIISIILGGGILWLLFWLLNNLGPNYWIYFWVAISAIIILLNLFYTSIFVPLFNKLTPLEDGELKDAIKSYSAKIDFPIDNIFVIDGSKRSTKANAYFSGLGRKKKIVLYDTLINDLTTEEIVSVLAHEVGHFKKKHILYSMVLSVLQIGAILYLSSFVLFNEKLSLAMGVSENALHINLVVFSILFSPISLIIGMLMSIFSRKNEYEADEYAKTTYKGEFLISSLKKLSKNSLSNITPHWLDVFLNYSHPTLLQRIRAMRK